MIQGKKFKTEVYASQYSLKRRLFWLYCILKLSQTQENYCWIRTVWATLYYCIYSHDTHGKTSREYCSGSGTACLYDMWMWMDKCTSHCQF